MHFMNRKAKHTIQTTKLDGRLNVSIVYHGAS